MHLLFTQHWSGSLLVIDGVHFWHGMCQSRDQVWLECKLFSLGVSWDQPDLNSLTFSTYLFSFLSFCFMLHVLHLIEKMIRYWKCFLCLKMCTRCWKRKEKPGKLKKNWKNRFWNARCILKKGLQPLHWKYQNLCPLSTGKINSKKKKKTLSNTGEELMEE